MSWQPGEPITPMSAPMGASVWTGETPLARAWLDAGGDPAKLHGASSMPSFPAIKLGNEGTSALPLAPLAWHVERAVEHAEVDFARARVNLRQEDWTYIVSLVRAAAIRDERASA